MRASIKPLGVSSVFLTTALFAGLFTLSSRPARAVCSPVENGYAFFSADEGTTSLGQEESIDSDNGNTDEIVVKVQLQNGAVVNVGESTNLVTVVPQGAGSVYDHAYYPDDADDNKTLTAYSIYTDPCTGQTHVFTTYIKVIPDTANDQ